MVSKTAANIAVLMPVYNPAVELFATLDGLRAQSVPFTLFLVDDGSKIHTDYETLTHGIDATIIRLPKNLGITGAMNAGLNEILKGNFAYVARIDTGDICTPERFSKQKAYLDAHLEIAILGSAVELRHLNDRNELTTTRVIEYPVSPDECRKQLFFNSPVSHPAVMVRRVVFEKLGGYSEAYPAAEDFDLMWRANRAGFKISNLADMLLIKEETPGSISQKRRRQQIFSRLRIQWANRRLGSPASWIGLARSITILLLPLSAMNTLKSVRRI
jgi:GT2 family glycosyltransferase